MSFWAGRRVLITGHSGFKGGWLSLWLQQLGAEVVGLSRGVPTRPAFSTLVRVDEGMTTVEADLLDREAVAAAVAEHRPEVVFHLAAQPIVRASFEDPVGTFATNALGTVHVLDAVRRAGGVRVVVSITTDKVYANREWVWGYREDDALGGHDPYAASKACAELVTASYRLSFLEEAGTAVSTARSGNVIGGGDWAADRLVPDLLRGALGGAPVRLRSPDAIRPWQHVLNPLDGYLRLAERTWDDPSLAGAYNFAPDPADAKPVAWIADRLRELWGDALRWEHDQGAHVHETRALRLDSSLAQAALDWRPTWHLDEALQQIVAFARAEQDGADLRAVALAQIDDFAAAAPGRV